MPHEYIAAPHTARDHRRLVCRVLFLLFTLAASAGASVTQKASDEPTLAPGSAFERRLAGGPPHVYRLALPASNYLHVVVQQRGIDVVVRLSGPDGGRLAEVDSLNGTQGPEHLYFVAASAGDYRLEVRPLNKSAAEGLYAIRVEELREAKGADSRRMKAETLFGEASQLRGDGSIESQRLVTAKCLEAATLYRALGDTPREVLMLNLGGLAYASLGERPKALDSFTRAAERARTAGDRSGEAVALSGLGLIAHTVQPAESARRYAESLTHFRALGDLANQAVVLNGLGLARLLLGEASAAREAFEEALPRARAVGDVAAESRSLVGLGFLRLRVGEWQGASDLLTEALERARGAGDRQAEGDALGGLGMAYNGLGEPRKALGYVSQAPEILRAVRDRQGEAAALNVMGETYAFLADKQKARESFGAALPVARAAGDRRNEAKALIGIGLIHVVSNETQQAFNSLEQGLAIARQINDRENEATALTFLGQAYSIMGEAGKAIASLTQAAAISQAINDRRGEGIALVFLGFAHLRALDPLRAHDSFTKALPLVRAVKDRNAEAQALNGLSVLNLGDPAKSLDHLEQALRLGVETGSRANQADTLNNTALAHVFSGRPERALEVFRRALQTYRKLRDRNGEATALLNLAWIEAQQGALNEARAHTEAAVNLMESLRTSTLNQSLRSTYFSTAQDYYEFYIKLLMALHKKEPSRGHDAEALRVSERARARALLDTLAEAKGDIRQGVEPGLLRREGALQRQLNEKAEEQMRLLAGSQEEARVAAVAKEVEALTNDLEKVKTEIRQTSPGYAALTQPRTLTLKEIQTQLLDRDTILLEYSLGKEGSFLWVVTPTSIDSFELPARAEIESAAVQFYESVSEPPLEPTGESGIRFEEQPGGETPAAQAAARLSRMLLAPVAPLLGKKRLLVVGDGTLQYIPFAALPDPAGGAGAAPLIVEHEMVTLPSASSLAILRLEPRARVAATKTLAVLADPVFERDDPRLAESLREAGDGDNASHAASTSSSPPGDTPDGLELVRLKHTRREAEALSKLVPPEQFTAALGFAATRAAASDPGLGRYRYLHFATHGFLNRQHPELSGLVLSRFDERGRRQDGFFRAHDIFNLKLAAELVVLSACQTGRGKDVRGEGLISLTRGFMYAGAPRVVVSLWNINDEATAELMARFYHGVLVEKMRPAKALQTAQVSFLKERPWARPYYWAAFTLQGEWR